MMFFVQSGVTAVHLQHMTIDVSLRNDTFIIELVMSKRLVTVCMILSG